MWSEPRGSADTCSTHPAGRPLHIFFVQVLLCDLTPFNKYYRSVGARRVLDTAMERVRGSARAGCCMAGEGAGSRVGGSGSHVGRLCGSGQFQTTYG